MTMQAPRHREVARAMDIAPPCVRLVSVGAAVVVVAVALALVIF